MRLTISTDISPYLGVEIIDVNLAESLGSRDIASLSEQLNQHHLLVIRKQKLTEEQLINVSKIFGEPVSALVSQYRLDKYPVITKHSNVKDENKQPTGAIAPEYVFHSDSYFTTNPNKATIFYSINSPEHGGETYFVNMCTAYDTLADHIKNIIANKKIIYKNAYINQPPVSHPMVRVHPITKKKALFVNIHRALGIDGLENSEALELINYLYHHATRSEFVYMHKWNDGDLLIWNNPTTMHCATTIHQSQKRLLYRILTCGDLPVT